MTGIAATLEEGFDVLEIIDITRAGYNLLTAKQQQADARSGLQKHCV